MFDRLDPLLLLWFKKKKVDYWIDYFLLIFIFNILDSTC